MSIDELGVLLDDFEEGVNGHRARISERAFNDVFKPVFEGRVGDNLRLITKWVELAGNEYSPVDLIGDNGEVVATVEGILRPLETDNRSEYNEVLKRFEKATSVLRINPIKAKAIEDSVVETLEQGLLPSNAKSRSYIKYVDSVEESSYSGDDIYDI